MDRPLTENSDLTTAIGAGLAPGAPRTRFVPLALALAVALLYLPTLGSFTEVWADQPYTHGYLIAAAVSWLAWRERRVFRSAPDARAASLLPAALVSMIWLLGTVMGTRVVAQLAIPAVFLLFAVGLWGRPAAERLTPVAAIFTLAVPFWGPLLTAPLQWATIAASNAVVSLARIPATLDGDTIHLASGSVVIASGCAGLNYFMSGITVGSLYAHVLAKGQRQMLATLALSAAVPILGNWIRVSSLIVIGHATEMRSIFLTQPRPHLIFGWTIFAVGMILFFYLAGRITRKPDASPSRQERAEVDPSVLLPTARYAPAPMLLVTTALCAGPLLYYGLRALPVRPVLATEISGSIRWSVTEADRPYGWEPAFRGADAHDAIVWTDGDRRVVVDRLTYSNQTQGSELIGFGSVIAPEGDVLTRPRMGMIDRGRIVNIAVVRDDAHPVLVWYWYDVGGVETASETRAKLLEVWAFARAARVSRLNAVSTPCAADDCAEASRALADFMGIA